ncbi:uncharacterized protein LOC135360841 isoform X2 [Latimeria chalumnae]|uniref:uncharacterized protein LOC135360841 isoform X2 n=1 Tax=Latimeria chalumnae TaxID=7897 RepID=UPI0003C175E9
MDYINNMAGLIVTFHLLLLEPLLVGVLGNQNIIGIKGKPFTFSCSTEEQDGSIEQLFIQWKRAVGDAICYFKKKSEEKHCAPGYDLQYTIGETNLTIEDVTEEHAGKYSCYVHRTDDYNEEIFDFSVKSDNTSRRAGPNGGTSSLTRDKMTSHRKQKLNNSSKESTLISLGPDLPEKMAAANTNLLVSLSTPVDHADRAQTILDALKPISDSLSHLTAAVDDLQKSTTDILTRMIAMEQRISDLEDQRKKEE